MFVFDDLITGSYSIRFIGGGYHPLFAAGQDQDGYYISTPSGTNLGPGDREWADQTMESIWSEILIQIGGSPALTLSDHDSLAGRDNRDQVRKRMDARENKGGQGDS